ncbi:cyclase family protein [Halovivax limisalsi]|uniref:cyclase family protein n=1 Tax=Halovivax limisalsi TaxID=1453760 RepID=UPI001FFD9EE9|nr:cyclase family protein [Halovivax limisalsi]
MFRDLTQPLDASVRPYPGDPPVEIEPAATMDSDGYRVSELHCATHSGTHVDAPSHTEAEGNTLSDYPVERFVFDARLVDCSGYDDREPIGPDALPTDDEGELLVIRTGWDAYWGTDRYLDHPYLAPDAAERCRTAGWSIGLDTLSPDPTPTDAARPDEPAGDPAHHALLGDDLFVVENLTNLAGLDRFELFAVPLPISGGDGSPVRAFARVD